MRETWVQSLGREYPLESPTHVARLEFPRETGLILRCAGKAGNPFQTTQGNRLSCRVKVKSESEVAQSCPTLSNPMECSLPGSSVHGICQARVLEWVAIAFSVWTAYRQLLVTLKPTHLHSFTNPPSRPFSFPVTFTFSASDLSDLSAPTCHKHSPM